MTALWPWLLFHLLIAALLALDLGVFHRRARAVTLREALGWSAVWIGVALLFNLGIVLARGPAAGLAFLTGYLVERSLSVDNLFVFLLLFAYFHVPAKDQHRVLFWGILGALGMRALFIAAGITLLHAVHWIHYLFGAFLVVTGIKLLREKDREVRPERNPVLRLFRRLVPVADHDGGGRFFLRQAGRWMATPLFVVLLVVETTDVIFAVDSIPAVLAVTTDPFIVYTSNVFAILGLRALYFAVAGIMPLFHYLSYGLSAILVFVGLKMVLADLYPVSIGASLGIIGGLLTAAMLASVLRPRRT